VGNIPMHWYDDYPHIGYCLARRYLSLKLEMSWTISLSSQKTQTTGTWF